MAISPIDYSIDVATPFASALQGYQAGAAIRQDRQQMEQQQAAQLQQKQLAQDLSAAASAPDRVGAIAALSVKYPHLSEPLKRSYDMLSAEQQKNRLSDATQDYAAVLNGQPEIAVGRLNQRADLLEKSGDAGGAAQARAMAKMIEIDKDHGANAMGLILSSALGPEKFSETFGKLGSERRAQELQPAAVAEAQAKATTAQVEAGNAPTKAVLDNEKSAQDIKTSEAQRKIAELDIQIRQANSETERGKYILEREKWQTELGKTQQGKGLAAQDALDSATALLNQIKGVQNHPGLDAGTGTLGGIRSYFNSSDAADFRRAVEGLKSPVFLNELAKLKAAGITLGQVTEAEGGKLERRIANLDPEQSTPSFRNQVGILLRDTERFIEKIKASGELPTKGGAFVVDSPTYGKVREGDINRLLTQFPGSTREQVLQFLQGQKGASGATGAY